jgi:hypothetical protein
VPQYHEESAFTNSWPPKHASDIQPSVPPLVEGLLCFFFCWVAGRPSIFGNKVAKTVAKEAAADGVQPFDRVLITDVCACLHQANILGVARQVNKHAPTS